MYTLTYVYAFLDQIKQSVVLSYVFIVFSLKKKHTGMFRSRDLDFELELYFFEESHTYLSSTCIPNFL